MPILMRNEFLKRKELIATAGGVVDTSEEGVKKALEATYDCLVDVHKEYIEQHANKYYIDFFNRSNDEAYTPEFGDKMFATLAINHEDLRMFTIVEIMSIFPTGIVQFKNPNAKAAQKYLRLYADELINYRDTRINVTDSRDKETT